MFETLQKSIVVLDCETTNLYPDGEIWDLAFDLDGVEHQFYFKPTMEGANARALKVGNFYKRTEKFKTGDWSDPLVAAPEIAAMLEGRHIVGAVPNFDENFLRDWFRKHGAILTTHYHLIDIETLIVGWQIGRWEQSKLDPTVETQPGPFNLTMPWDSNKLSASIGVNPEDFDRHTAMGDVRWVRAQLEKLLEGP